MLLLKLLAEAATRAATLTVQSTHALLHRALPVLRGVASTHTVQCTRHAREELLNLIGGGRNS